jgi:hypothetical protein
MAHTGNIKPLQTEFYDAEKHYNARFKQLSQLDSRICV